MQAMVNQIIFLFIGLIVGFFIGYLLIRFKLLKSGQSAENAKYELEKKLDVLQSKWDMSLENNLKLEREIDTERRLKEQANERIAKAEAEYRSLREKLDSQKQEMEELQKKFTLEFENIASKILKENTKDFTNVNQKTIHELLTPLKEKIQTFERKVEDTYQKGLKDQTDLKAELKKLYDLNNRISEEANNLTRALTSDSKKQGNWGEIVLERVLERSGLIKGQEYETQITVRDDKGNMLRPDVVVYLPDEKHVIIDAKVSLTAYEAYVNEEKEDRKINFLKQHIDSIKKHVKELDDKNYQGNTLFDTPDFVLMFLPIESAFSLAVQSDLELFNYAWEKKIVIVSPTTLLATLRTIASLWKHEKQTKNALEIARQGGALYDKFVGFLNDMKDLGLQLSRAQKSFESASNKLYEGKGNLVRSVDRLKELGAKTSKQLPEKN